MNNAQKISFVSKMHDFVRSQAQNRQQDVPKGLPCHVSAIKGKNNQGDFYEVTFDVNNTVFTLPKITIPAAFSKYKREPTQVGDKGYVVPGSIFLGGSDGVDGSIANIFSKGNLTTGVFHAISSTDWDTRDPSKYYHTGGPGGYIARSADEHTSMEIDKTNNINHTSSAGIAHSAIQNIIHTAGQILSHNGSTINQIAQSGLTHAVLNGAMNLVSKGTVTVGAPPASSGGSTTFPTPPTPPIPTLPTIFNVIGSIGSTSMSTGAPAPADGGNGVPNITYINSAFAFSDKTIASPIAPSSTSAFFMQGLAGSITPTAGGNIQITICGTIIASGTPNVNDGIVYQISYGTGSAPLNGGVLAGTQIGLAQSYSSAVVPTAAGDVHVPFSITYIAAGLTAKTAYWIDLSAKSITTISQMGLHNVMITAVEI
jgi:hypothetical protein